MFVLVDVEWYEGNGFAFITQLSGLLVDEKCNIVDQFDSLISPVPSVQPERLNWNHISFGNHRKKDFLRAPAESYVIDQFQRWLVSDDILIFWHEESEKIFRHSFDQSVFEKCETRVIGKHVRKFLPDSKRSGSPARICALNKFPVTGQEHNSSADVANLRTLLASVSFPLQLLVTRDWQKRLCQWLECPAEDVDHTSQKPPRLMNNQYCVDSKINRIHLVGCPNISDSKSFSIINLKKAVTRNFLPCSCCYKKLEAYVFSHTATPQTTSLVYSSVSRSIVHHADCPVVKRIDPTHRKKFKNAAVAKQRGYHFCKVCSTVEKYVRPIRYYVDHYCEDNGLKYEIKSGAMHICSQYDRWQIILDAGTGLPTLYHKNRNKHRDSLPESCIPGYHLQERTPHTIPGILKSIVDHDCYRRSTIKSDRSAKREREIKPPRSKSNKQASNMKKQKNERSKIAAMWASYDELYEEHYSL